MGIFSKAREWLSDKSDRFIRGEATAPSSYYASDEYEEAYGSMRDADEASREAGSATGGFAAVNRDYGGRVPYQSQREMQQRAQEQAYAQQSADFAAQGTGRMPPVAAQAPNSAPMAQAASTQPGYAQGAYPGYQGGGQAAYAQQPNYAQQPPQSNVVPFPGMQRAPDGSLYTHVEYIVSLHGRSECTNIIEYIKQNASVFLSMECIADETERQRCVDMLSGAAYTLGCALNKISFRGIYLISAPSVYVVLDPSIKKMSYGQEGRAFHRAEGYQGYTQRPDFSAYAAQPARPTQQSAAYAPQQNAAYVAQQSAYAGGQTARQAVYAAQQSAYAGSTTNTFQAAAGTASFQPVTGARSYAEYQQ